MANPMEATLTGNCGKVNKTIADVLNRYTFRARVAPTDIVLHKIVMGFGADDTVDFSYSGYPTIYQMNLKTYELSVVSGDDTVHNIWGVECDRVVLLGISFMPTFKEACKSVYKHSNSIGCYMADTRKWGDADNFDYYYSGLSVCSSREEAIKLRDEHFNHQLWIIDNDGKTPKCLFNGYCSSWEYACTNLITSDEHAIEADFKHPNSFKYNGRPVFRSREEAVDFVNKHAAYEAWSYDSSLGTVKYLGTEFGASMMEAMHKFGDVIQMRWDVLNISHNGGYAEGSWYYGEHPVFGTKEKAEEYAKKQRKPKGIFSLLFGSHEFNPEKFKPTPVYSVWGVKPISLEPVLLYEGFESWHKTWEDACDSLVATSGISVVKTGSDYYYNGNPVFPCKLSAKLHADKQKIIYGESKRKPTGLISSRMPESITVTMTPSKECQDELDRIIKMFDTIQTPPKQEVVVSISCPLDDFEIRVPKKPVSDMACYDQVANLIGEGQASIELFRVLNTPECEIDFDIDDFALAFEWHKTPQGYKFWDCLYRNIRTEKQEKAFAECKQKSKDGGCKPK